MCWGLCLNAAPVAAEAEGESSFKLLQGTVSAVNSQGIAVEHARTETSSEEMYLPLDPKVKLQRIQSIKDLQPGDIVLVEYREMMLKDEQGKYTRSSRVAVRVALVTRAPEPLPGQPVVEEAEDAEPSTQP